MKSNSNYDVIVVGAGPAGLSASIYLKRANVKVLVIEANSPGGTLNKIYNIENYPGYTESDGTTLAFRMYSQAEKLGVDFKTDKVINIEQEDNNYKIVTSNNFYYSKIVLIASGKVPRKLSIKEAEKYENKGISYCTYCDGPLYKNKDIAIIGGGNTAMESVKYMNNLARKIYVINRSLLRADEIEQEILNNNDKIEVIVNANLKQINGDENKITSIQLDNGRKINVDAIFVCIGVEASNKYFQNLNLNSDNLGIIVDKNMKSSRCGVYACGDAISKKLYQVVTAVSEGAQAATSIIKELKTSIK